VTEPTIVIVCELGELEELTHQQAAVFEKHLRRAHDLVFPEHRIRGLWVHRALSTARAELAGAVDRVLGFECSTAEERLQYVNGWPSRFDRVCRDRDTARTEAGKLRRERDDARGLARILAHAYQTDNRPPPRVVADALAFPAIPAEPSHHDEAGLEGGVPRLPRPLCPGGAE